MKVWAIENFTCIATVPDAPTCTVESEVDRIPPQFPPEIEALPVTWYSKSPEVAICHEFADFMPEETTIQYHVFQLTSNSAARSDSSWCHMITRSHLVEATAILRLLWLYSYRAPHWSYWCRIGRRSCMLKIELEMTKSKLVYTAPTCS